MPYKKKYKKKAAPAKVSQAVKKYVATKIDKAVEDKYISLTYSFGQGTAAWNSTGSVTALTGIAQGTDASERIGNKVRVKHLNFRLSCRSFADTTFLGGATRTRIILFRDTMSLGGATPAVLDVLQVAAPESPYDLDFRGSKRFVVLMDQFFVLDAITLTAAGAAGIWTTKSHHTLTKSLRVNFDQHYDANAAANWSRNAVYILLLSSEATARAPALLRTDLEYTYEDA